MSASTHFVTKAAVAQLGERQTEDLKVPGSIPGGGICFFIKTQNPKCLRWGSNPGILRILELKSSALDHSATKAPMKTDAPSGIRTRVQRLGSVDDNPYTNGAQR